MTEHDQPTGSMAAIPGPAFEPPTEQGDVKRCPACLSPVRQDQRYCLECGERLLADEIPPPPGVGSISERANLGLVGAAVVLALVGLVLAWVALRDDGGKGGRPTTTGSSTASTPTDTTPTATTPTDTTPTATTPTDTTPTDTSGGGGDWPADQSGWAVILASKAQSTFQESDAQAIADRAKAAGVEQVGVLDSSQFPSLNPGYWAVFSGPYGSKAEAEAAAVAIQGQGFPDAYPRDVQP